MRVRLLSLLWFGVALFCGAGPAQAQNRFNLVNNTGQVIEQVYASPSRLNTWGADILGQNVLPPGQSVWVVPRQSDCLIDIRVVYRGGREETRSAINTCQLTTITWGGGGAARSAQRDPSFRFVNSTRSTVNEVYVSLSNDRNWGPDRLGQDTLGPGESAVIRLPVNAGCTVDIRVVYTDGRVLEKRGVETCSIEQLNFR